MVTPKWTVKVSRKHNPDRTVVAYGKTAEQAEQDAKDSLRGTYGISDASKIEVVRNE
ncbi:hypothetical protein QUB68_28285 [Microcoleus sp. A006_D1]|uniref:hypothetical protein n=1 Tax=Microcoleus sp. A006_D1 TaxID=3055267 RepID=UPI002FD2BBE7